MLQEPSLFEATLPSFHSHVEHMLDELSEKVTHPSATVGLPENAVTTIKTVQTLNKKGVEEEIPRFCSACFASLFLLVKQYDTIEVILSPLI